MNDHAGVNGEIPDALLVSDVEQLRALADPLRIEILDVMGQHPIRSWTAKELAGRIGGSQTRLYRHLALLEERGLIRVASTRVVSGITERRYQVMALNYRMDRSLVLGGGAGELAVNQVLDIVFERARAEIMAGVRAGLIDVDPTKGPTRMVMATARGRLGPGSVQRVTELFDELDAIASRDEPDGKEYGLVAGFYPRLADGRSDR